MGTVTTNVALYSGSSAIRKILIWYMPAVISTSLAIFNSGMPASKRRSLNVVFHHV